MADGYRVDLAALRAAAQGIRDTVARRSAPPWTVGAAAGHAGLAATVDGFVGRWEEGLRTLTSDAHALAEHLEAADRAYRAAEDAGARPLGAVLAGPGTEPAAG